MLSTAKDKAKSYVAPMRGRGFGRGPAGGARNDPFRSRAPNTSRPPSLHVDDFVALEKNNGVAQAAAAAAAAAAADVDSGGGGQILQGALPNCYYWLLSKNAVNQYL